MNQTILSLEELLEETGLSEVQDEKPEENDKLRLLQALEEFIWE